MDDTKKKLYTITLAAYAQEDFSMSLHGKMKNLNTIFYTNIQRI